MNDAFNIILADGHTDMFVSFHSTYVFRTADITNKQCHCLEQPFHTHTKSFLKHSVHFNLTYHHKHSTFVCGVNAVTVNF